MLPVIQIGPIAFQTTGLLIILGLWLGLSLAEKWAPRFNTDPRMIDNLVLITLISGIFSARLLYAIRYVDIFLKSPLNLISLNPGLLDPVGGVAVGLLTTLIYGNRKKVSFFPILDTLTPLLSVTLIFYALSQFASGQSYGAETALPWGVFLWGARRHPVQLYSALANLLILVAIWPRSSRNSHENQPPGLKFFTFTALSAIVWIFLETFRGNSDIWFFNLRTAQIIAWIIFAISLARLTNILRASQD